MRRKLKCKFCGENTHEGEDKKDCEMWRSIFHSSEEYKGSPNQSRHRFLCGACGDGNHLNCSGWCFCNCGNG